VSFNTKEIKPISATAVSYFCAAIKVKIVSALTTESNYSFMKYEINSGHKHVIPLKVFNYRNKGRTSRHAWREL
jgi:hypothetical protein